MVPHRNPRPVAKGFSLTEVLLVTALVMLLLSLALPGYRSYVKDAKVAAAIGDIGKISLMVEKYELNNMGVLPASLADVGADGLLDPWERPYVYTRLAGGGTGSTGAARKDKNLNPINSDFDLFSKGEDGETAGPLTAKQSKDDIVRALDGRFVGLGEDF